ncbi:hypothetical protein G9A89_021245 [Geosiphon pyriformis]|nr:hypothetical protein G9A89_021245 [Geosiphon pyriformis]
MAPLINFEEEKPKPTWEAYQVSWANEEYNELPPILSWDDNKKKKQTNEFIWETDDLTWTDNEQEEVSTKACMRQLQQETVVNGRMLWQQ